MDAQLRPLKGKYYGTEVWTASGVITVWLGQSGDEPDSYQPSLRQLAYWGLDSIQDAREHDMMCDAHWESALNYRVARAIGEALRSV